MNYIFLSIFFSLFIFYIFEINLDTNLYVIIFPTNSSVIELLCQSKIKYITTSTYTWNTRYTYTMTNNSTRYARHLVILNGRKTRTQCPRTRDKKQKNYTLFFFFVLTYIYSAILIVIAVVVVVIYVETILVTVIFRDWIHATSCMKIIIGEKASGNEGEPHRSKTIQKVVYTQWRAREK